MATPSPATTGTAPTVPAEVTKLMPGKILLVPKSSASKSGLKPVSDSPRYELGIVTEVNEIIGCAESSCPSNGGTFAGDGFN